MAPHKGDLNCGEQRLIAAARNGTPVDFTGGKETLNVRAEGAGWSAERTIRGEVIAGLCTSTAEEPVHRKGVQVLGARIVGFLDLEAAALIRPLTLVHCWLEHDINLRDAQTKTIRLSGSVVPGIQANRASIGGSIFLDNGFESGDTISMVDASVTGSIIARGAKFKSSTGAAFEGSRLAVKGAILFSNGYASDGEIRLVDASIRGFFFCADARMRGALVANRLRVKGSVFFQNGVRLSGGASFIGAQIDGSFECEGSSCPGCDLRIDLALNRTST